MFRLPRPCALRQCVRSVGRAVVPSSQKSLGELFRLLTPWETGVSLVRIGSEGDGGYLVPDDFETLGALFSPGVSETWDFERVVGEQFRIPSYMVDGSVDAPEELTDLQTFDRLWLGAKTTQTVVSLQDWVASRAPDPAMDLMLQMDIEGAEYGALAASPLSTLRRFRWAVIEFHGLDWAAVDPVLRFRILPALRRMAVDFEVVHVHPNNCCGVLKIGGRMLPKVLEVTYLRRDRLRRTPTLARLPHELDRDCVPSNPSIDLGADWPIA